MFHRNKFNLRIFPYRILILQTCTIIIVCRSTPEIRSQLSTFVYHLCTIDTITVHKSVLLIELNIECFATDFKTINIFIISYRRYNRNILLCYILEFHIRSIITFQYYLILCNYMSCRNKIFTCLLYIFHVQKPLTRFIKLT